MEKKKRRTREVILDALQAAGELRTENGVLVSDWAGVSYTVPRYVVLLIAGDPVRQVYVAAHEVADLTMVVEILWEIRSGKATERPRTTH